MLPLRLACALLLALSASPFCSAQIKVACIGDSITEGAGLANAALESYPAKMGRLLGDGYLVRNYGVSGRTLLKKGDFPYWNETAYRQSREWNPDIVVIQLGTNDSKPQNWRYDTNYISDYDTLIASYTNLVSRPRVFLCTPCPVYGNGAYDIRPAVVRTNIAPKVFGLGERLGHAVIDLHTAMGGHAEWFPDTVHPNSRGMTVMAAVIRNAIVGAKPLKSPPGLATRTTTLNRTILSWPTEAAGWVLQSSSSFRDSNSVWTVVEQVAANNGTSVQVTNSMAGLARFYRLWQPFFQ